MPLLLALVIFVAAIGPGRADDAAIARRVADRFAMPRYEALASAMATQNAAWIAFCAAPDGAAWPGLQTAFARAADAWASVEILRYGPVTQDARLERIDYFPERKNAIGRGLAALLAGQGDADLQPKAFADQSVAIQGLPALERLLFDGPDPMALLLNGTPSASRRCAVGKAITANLAAIASDIIAGWRAEPDGLAAQLAKPDIAREFLTRTATDLLTLYQAIDDSKMKPVFGERPDAAKPAMASYRRSGRTNRTIELNLESAVALTRVLLEGAAAADTTIETAESALSIAQSMPADIGAMATDQKGRSRVQLLITAVRTARDTAAAAVPGALGITLGFNSLDGD